MKPIKPSLGKRILLWITTPLRKFIQYRFKVSITKDIALYEAKLRIQKPHWSERMVQKRARSKYAGELKKIGVI